jgi:hypothetical protein
MKLAKYKRGDKSYNKIGIHNNWYREMGITNLMKQIEDLERQIKIKSLGNKLVNKVDE